MKAHEIIDRLASLDEGVEAPEAEPTVEPTTTPETPPVRRERPSTSPFDPPPDFDPDHMPRPKAEDEHETIDNWLRMTRQPVADWDWDGQQLRMQMDDGTTEVYGRAQLQDSGIFDGQVGFAESEDVEIIEEPLTDEPMEVTPFSIDSLTGDTDDTEIPATEVPASSEAAGVLDQIMGRCRPAPCTDGEGATGPIVIEIEGDHAEKLAKAVGNIVKDILGLADREGTEKAEPDEEKDDKEEDDDDKPKDKPKSKKSDKPKGKKKKSKDEDTEEDDSNED